MGATSEAPPSVEQLAHEIRRWQTGTLVGRAVARTGAIEATTHNLTAYCPSADRPTMCTALLRIASLLANEPNMPGALVISLLAAVGAELLDQETDQTNTETEAPS